MESKGVQVPVAIEVVATGKFLGIFSKKIVQRYDFYNFLYNARPNRNKISVST